MTKYCKLSVDFPQNTYFKRKRALTKGIFYRIWYSRYLIGCLQHITKSNFVKPNPKPGLISENHDWNYNVFTIRVWHILVPNFWKPHNLKRVEFIEIWRAVYLDSVPLPASFHFCCKLCRMILLPYLSYIHQNMWLYKTPVELQISLSYQCLLCSNAHNHPLQVHEKHALTLSDWNYF